MPEKTIKEAIEDLKVMICNYVSSVGGQEDFKKKDFSCIGKMLSNLERLSQKSCKEDIAMALYFEHINDNTITKSNMWDTQTDATQDLYRKKAELVLSWM